jgi:hypothetical protein
VAQSRELLRLFAHSYSDVFSGKNMPELAVQVTYTAREKPSAGGQRIEECTRRN